MLHPLGQFDGQFDEAFVFPLLVPRHLADEFLDAVFLDSVDVFRLTLQHPGQLRA